MKKVLVLMLVLGMASMASATLTLGGPTTANPGDVVTITVSSDATDSYYTYLGIGSVAGGPGWATDDAVGSMAMPVATANAGPAASVMLSSSWMVTAAATPPDVITPGVHFNAEVTIASGASIGDTYTIATTTLGNYNTCDQEMTITVIPEPMTLGLLGLGTLLLRRRK